MWLDDIDNIMQDWYVQFVNNGESPLLTGHTSWGYCSFALGSWYHLNYLVHLSVGKCKYILMIPKLNKFSTTRINSPVWCLFQDTPPPVRPSPISTSQREPLSLLSQNTPELHPYQESPPPYLTQPEFRPKFLSKQGYSSSTPHYGNTPRALTIPDNDLTIDNTTNGLLADLTYGSLDGTMARTHMSLNSSGGGSRNYLAEEAELANLLKKLDLAFPGDVTMSQTGEW